jgi:hypothetical protein
MKTKITRFARGAKCGFFTINGETRSFEFAAAVFPAIAASATYPKPQPTFRNAARLLTNPFSDPPITQAA